MSYGIFPHLHCWDSQQTSATVLHRRPALTPDKANKYLKVQVLVGAAIIKYLPWQKNRLTLDQPGRMQKQSLRACQKSLARRIGRRRSKELQPVIKQFIHIWFWDSYLLFCIPTTGSGATAHFSIIISPRNQPVPTEKPTNTWCRKRGYRFEQTNSCTSSGKHSGHGRPHLATNSNTSQYGPVSQNAPHIWAQCLNGVPDLKGYIIQLAIRSPTRETQSSNQIEVILVGTLSDPC